MSRAMAVAAAFWLCLISARPALAEPAPRRGPSAAPLAAEESPSALARRFGMDGLLAYERAEFTEALRLFAAAEEAAHSPVFQLYMARSLIALGRTNDARPLLQLIVNEAGSNEAPDAWLRARVEAAEALTAQESTSEAPDEKDATFANGPADGGSERAPRAAKPESPARPPNTIDSHSAPAAALPPVPPLGFWNRATPPERGGVALFGVGGAGLLLGVLAGGAALIEAVAIKGRCVDGSCRVEDAPRAERARELAELATFGFGVALAGAAGGSALLLWPGASRAKSARQAVDVALQARATGASLRLSGRF